MTSTMSEEDIQRTINMCSGLVALTREDFINPPRMPTSEELESNFLSSINYVTRSPTYEPERIWNSSSGSRTLRSESVSPTSAPAPVPGRSHQWRHGNRNVIQKKIVKKYRKIAN